MNSIRNARMEMMAVAVMAALVQTLPAQAQQKPDEHAVHQAESSATKTLPLVDGEVRRIDKPAGKLTIRHAPIPNLDMPAMSMVFRVRDPDMLNTVSPGDKVKFSAEKVDGAFVVTAIVAAIPAAK